MHSTSPRYTPIFAELLALLFCFVTLALCLCGTLFQYLLALNGGIMGTGEVAGSVEILILILTFMLPAGAAALSVVVVWVLHLRRS